MTAAPTIHVGDDSRRKEAQRTIAGRYRIVSRLGAGGMGEAYRVIDLSTQRTLALKRFVRQASPAKTARLQLRFRREFHTMARMQHPRIVEVYEYGLDAELAYYTMELLDGQDLADLGAVDPIRACKLLRDVASALAFLHTHRLVHRDVAPRNVRCTQDGRAKLIDFGVIASPGLCGDVAGTPPVVSPENVRGLPIDHRADLYGLGALAYCLLTGQHAYPARTFGELEALWRRGLAPLAQVAPHVPPALGELVGSLLHLDPLARPASAAEVIDRLGAIAGLAPAPDVEAVHGYLSSATMVGRSREIEAARRRLRKAREGEGCAILVEAPSGLGKSRLLREIGLEAQLAGAAIATVDSDSAGRGPYGVVRALCVALLSAAGDEAALAAKLADPVLGRVVPELAKLLAKPPPARSGGGLEEERMRLQEAFTGWFLAVATTRALTLLLDDVQRADEASAAVLASLASRATNAKLVLVATVRTDEPIRASAAVTALRDSGMRIRLRALGAPEVETLLRGIFGDAPRIARLSSWLHCASGGIPLHCMELSRHLVDGGVVRYEGGVWAIPPEIDVSHLPSRLSQAMDARIASLSAPARALAQALSVHGGEVTLALCVALSGGSSEAEVFHCLDELLDAEVLLGTEDSYRFRHDGLRESLLRGLDDTRKAELHLRVGQVLAAAGEVDVAREAEVGWHLLRGGDRRRGAELLASAGRKLFDAQSFSDCIAPLQAAVEVFESMDGATALLLELRHMLVMAGCLGNREAALKFGQGTLQALAQHAGMDIVKRLGALPGFLPLALGLLVVGIRRLLTRPNRRGLPPMVALRMFYSEAAYLVTTYCFVYDFRRAREVCAMLEPLRSLGRRIPAGAWFLTRALLGVGLGRMGLVRQMCADVSDILASDRLTPISDADRATTVGATEFMLTAASVHRQEPDSIERIAKLSSLGLRYFVVSATIWTLLYRRLRGEEDEALALESNVELQLVQAGSVWGPEVQIVVLSSLAYAQARDVLGLRRSIAQMTHLVDKGFNMMQHLELIRGEYHRERGELAASRAALERALAAVEDSEESIVRVSALIALAETHLAAGDAEPAIRCATEALAIGRQPDVLQTALCARASRVLALARAAAGDPDAGKQLDQAIDDVTATGSPLLCGALHEARARIALARGDMATYAAHREATESWFRATRNPALVARAERLHALGAPTPSAAQSRAAPPMLEAPTTRALRQAVLTQKTVTISDVEEGVRWASVILSGCRGPDERANRALELLLDGCGAAEGYLYLLRGDELEIVAPSYGDEPPQSLVRELVGARPGDTTGAERVELRWRPSRTQGEALWHRIWLRVGHGGDEQTSGLVGAALVMGDSGSHPPPQALIDRIARELFDAGDAAVSDGRLPL